MEIVKEREMKRKKGVKGAESVLMKGAGGDRLPNASGHHP